MVLRAKGGEIRRHQQRIKQSIKGGGGAKKKGTASRKRGGIKRILQVNLPPPPVINKDRTLNS